MTKRSIRETDGLSPASGLSRKTRFEQAGFFAEPHSKRRRTLDATSSHEQEVRVEEIVDGWHDDECGPANSSSLDELLNYEQFGVGGSSTAISLVARSSSSQSYESTASESDESNPDIDAHLLEEVDMNEADEYLQAEAEADKKEDKEQYPSYLQEYLLARKFSLNFIEFLLKKYSDKENSGKYEPFYKLSRADQAKVVEVYENKGVLLHGNGPLDTSPMRLKMPDSTKKAKMDLILARRKRVVGEDASSSCQKLSF